MRKNGTEFPVELSLATWFLYKERYYTGIIRDIGERKQAEKALRMSEQALRAKTLELEDKNEVLENTLNKLQKIQNQLIMQEKMASLGKLSAGMAHELNNPAAVAQRGASQLQTIFDKLRDVYLKIGELGLKKDQLDEVIALEKLARERANQPDDMDALTRSDKESEMENWLEEKGTENAWQLAPTLVSLGYDQSKIYALAENFTPRQFSVVINWLSTTHTIHSLLSEIILGADRIVEIVKALKAYTFMDRAPIQTVNIHEGLDNTLIILKNKLKTGITVHREYAGDLPAVQAYGSELNQVWTNIIDNAIERDLRKHYHRDYRIIKVASGTDALETVTQLKRRNAPMAFFLVDQRMPGMTGTEFLEEAIKLYPDARKALLTAYADTDAAISSINSIGLDYYFMKPWDPPEQYLYPVMDDLLSDWQASVPVPYDGIRVAGTQWSACSHNVKDFLARNQIPYQWLDIEKDAQARTLVETVQKDRHLLPVVFFPDGSVLVDPSLSDLAAKAGLHTRARQPFYDLIIIGAGPAGLASALYGASEGLRTVVIEKQAAGGQAGTSSRIENYLGFPQGLSGVDLARRATAQAIRLGAEILTAQEATGVRVADPYRFVTLGDGTELSCHALIISTGMTVRKPDLAGIEPFIGASVYYGAAFTEAKHYQGGHVIVLGGANSAGQGAVFLSQFADRVTILIRGDSLEKKMSKYLVDQINKLQNIEVRRRTEVIEFHGTHRLQAVTLQNRETGTTEKVQADAMFIFIGATPHTEIVANVVERDSAGFIYTGPYLIQNGRRPKNWSLKRDPYLLETSVPGIFAAGDVRHGVVRRVASAVGQGAVAVSFVHQYLETV